MMFFKRKKALEEAKKKLEEEAKKKLEEEIRKKAEKIEEAKEPPPELPEQTMLRGASQLAGGTDAWKMWKELTKEAGTTPKERIMEFIFSDIQKLQAHIATRGGRAMEVNPQEVAGGERPAQQRQEGEAGAQEGAGFPALLDAMEAMAEEKEEKDKVKKAKFKVVETGAVVDLAESFTRYVKEQTMEFINLVRQVEETVRTLNEVAKTIKDQGPFVEFRRTIEVANRLVDRLNRTLEAWGGVMEEVRTTIQRWREEVPTIIVGRLQRALEEQTSILKEEFYRALGGKPTPAPPVLSTEEVKREEAVSERSEEEKPEREEESQRKPPRPLVEEKTVRYTKRDVKQKRGWSS